jgi:hypothetical protein
MMINIEFKKIARSKKAKAFTSRANLKQQTANYKLSSPLSKCGYEVL